MKIENFSLITYTEGEKDIFHIYTFKTRLLKAIIIINNYF